MVPPQREPMRAVRSQGIAPHLQPLMLACQGDMLGPQNRELGGQRGVDVHGAHRAPARFARSTLDTWLKSSMTPADTGSRTCGINSWGRRW